MYTTYNTNYTNHKKTYKKNTKPKSKSKIKLFFEKLINNEIDKIKQETNMPKEKIIAILNKALETKIWTLILNKHEETEFRSVSKRNYDMYKDVATLNTYGEFNSEHHNAKLLCEVLRQQGIKPPITVLIRKENNKIKIKIRRYSN